MKNKRIVLILGIIAGLLAIPLVAMQFTSEVNWTVGDFVVMFALLLTTSLFIDLALRKVNTKTLKLTTITAIVTGFLIIWAQLAVGIF